MNGLLVTCDDYGLCTEVNEAVCLLHDAGIVGRASLLVNTPLFDRCVAELKERPGLEVGVHLNLTDGPPVLPAASVPTLVDRRGLFPGGRHYRVAARLLAGRSSPREAHAEWRAQIRRALDAGLRVRHLNSHGHIHLLPPLHGVVADLVEEFAVPHLRLVLRGKGLRGRLLRRPSQRLLDLLRARGLRVEFPRAVLGLGRPGSLDRGGLLSEMASVREGTSELLVHAALGPNDYHRRWRYAGVRETRFLLAARERLLPR